jgi:SAM-dependent methyltransferase
VPQLYHAYQSLGGFFQARVKAFDDYLDFSTRHKVFDIGCGPGHISAKIPPSLDYIGFDSDEKYIQFANARFGGPKRRFYNRLFDPTAASDFGIPDLIMMNGLLHHLDDAGVHTLLLDAYNAVDPGGIVFTLDGCFVDGQNSIDRYLLENDRGEFVRTEQGYRALIPSEFGKIDVFLRNNISRIPYTFIITRLQKLQ